MDEANLLPQFQKKKDMLLNQMITLRTQLYLFSPAAVARRQFAYHLEERERERGHREWIVLTADEYQGKRDGLKQAGGSGGVAAVRSK